MEGNKREKFQPNNKKERGALMDYKKILLSVIVLAIFSLGIQTYASPINLFKSSESNQKDSKPEKDQKKKDTKKSYLIGFNTEEGLEKTKKDKKWDSKKFKKFKKLKTIVITLTDEEFTELKENTSITYIEEDFGVESFETEPVQNNQTIPWGVKEVGALEGMATGSTGKEIKVAVLDTGIFPHEDLKVEAGFSTVTNNTSYIDDQGHGTHVAGTIAAINNDIGVLGIAPEITLYSVKVLDSNGGGTYSQVIEGLEWAIDQGVNIISMSFGGRQHSQALQEIIVKANDLGIMMVAAAGNSGKGQDTLAYPAKYHEVLAIGAIDSLHERAPFSSSGIELDLVAPGVNILSTRINGEYAFLSGTSMAAPHVTGVAAALWSKNPSWSNEKIKNKLLETAITLGDEQEYGKGLVSLSRALGLEETSNTETIPKGPLSEFEEFDISYDFQKKTLTILKEEAIKQNNIDISKEIDNIINGMIVEHNQIYSDYRQDSEDSVDYKNQDHNEYAQEFFSANRESFDKISKILNEKINQFAVELEIESTSLTSEVNQLYSTKLSLNESINVDLPEGISQVYTFIPTVSSNYRIYTGAYGGVGALNDTVIELYSDSTLTTKIQMNDDSNGTLFSEINNILEAGKTYFIKLSHFNNVSKVHASLNVVFSENTITKKILLDTPHDINLGRGLVNYFEFNVQETGTYKFLTSYYEGTTSSGTNDTVLKVFADEQYSKQIAYNDNSNETLFSEIKLNLTAGSKVYVQISGYGGRSVYARLMATKDIGLTQTLSIDKTVLASVVGINQFNVISFTPTRNGLYRFNTSQIKGNLTPQDTYLYLFEDSTLTRLLAKNDDGLNTLHSVINYQLHAGKTYYLLLRGYNGQAITANVNVSEGHFYFYDLNGKLDYILLSNGQKLDYQYDENGNLVKKIMILAPK
jgi:hypothetical protein